MCGIAGVAGPGGAVPPALLRRMCASIRHRGPDDEGIHTAGGVGLGMRRLSIIDLAGGHQPIANEDGTVWIVFNGEIYNFPELHRELEARGHHFSTHTDTEVIVHLYEELGEGCVQRLRGMFAFALYDERSATLLLARDRLGIKPLHYAESGGRLLFASEIKAILEAAPELAELDPGALAQYFHFDYISDPSTAFRRVRRLPPGYLLKYSRGNIQLRRYWDLPAYGTLGGASEQECLEELERRLAEAVRIRLISEVPLGAFLSGGTDSSLVVALMARASARPVKTFTIGFTHGDFDEAAYARQVAARFATEHHELIMEPEIGPLLERLSASLEEPLGDDSIIPTFLVSQVAREHVTVALSGDGGDELFAGYDRYPAQLRRAWLDQLPAWAARGYQQLLFPLLPRPIRGRKLASNLTLPTRERYLDGISALGAGGHGCSALSADFLSTALAQAVEPYRAIWQSAPARDLLSKMLYLDTKTYLPADILTKVDRMSMAVSLEARVPILDHEVVEWATQLPAKWKLRGRQRKWLLKKLAQRAGVPPGVLHRRKQGFTPPLRHWMRRELREELARVLLEPRTLQRGYFDALGVESLLQEHFSGRRDRSPVLWQLLMFELWHRNFLERRSAPVAAAGAAVEAL